MSWHHVPKDDAWMQAHLAMPSWWSRTSSPAGISSTCRLRCSRSQRRCAARDAGRGGDAAGRSRTIRGSRNM